MSSKGAQMPKDNPPQILVAFDFSETSELALQHALNLAFESPPRDFHFLVALEPRKGLGLRANEVIDYQYTEEVQAIATKHIGNAIAKLDRGGEVSMLVHVRIGDPVTEILSLAEEVGASLILVGSHGRQGVERMLLGSVSERVVREALCPVMVARERTYENVRRSKIIDAPNDEPEYVPPHRYHHDSGAPIRPKAWALY
jgi:nucleotide-binding universal stress UspA family protein